MENTPMEIYSIMLEYSPAFKEIRPQDEPLIKELRKVGLMKIAVDTYNNRVLARTSGFGKKLIKYEQ